MKLAGKRIAYLLEEGFEDLEFYVPLMRLQEEGAVVTVVGTKMTTYHGKACLAAGLVTAGLLWFGQRLPVPGALVGLLAMGGGALAAVPFIWPEIKLLLKM